jgi:cytochrome c-type biogenesis protein
MAEWYALLSKLNNLLSPIITGTAREINIPFITALLLGLLGSTAPCQLSTNASALGLVAQKIEDNRRTLIGTFAFIAGKVIAYTVIGSFTILLGIKLNQAAIPIIQIVRKALGPLMFFIGLLLLGLFKPVLSNFDIGKRLLNYTPKSKILPEFVLGIVFSLAFCPTLFWLFFGMVVPLGLATKGGILLPGILAIGTAIPLLIFAVLLTSGVRQARSTIRDLRKFNNLVQKISGVIFILAGINDIVSYWLI